MSYRSNNFQQITLNDRLNSLTKRERGMLDKSWAVPFGNTIYPLINEEKFEVLYNTENGRPHTPVNIIIGALLLKEYNQVTDEELFECMLFDSRYQYALRLTSYDEIPFSDRTLSRFRERLYRHEMETGEDLIKEEIERLSNELAKLMGISGRNKRMDSLMVSSSCKNMGRLELMYTCVANLVKGLIKHNEAEGLPDHLLKYAEASDKNSVCYRLDKDEVQSRLTTVMADALLLYELAETTQNCVDEYQILELMLNNQTKNGELKPNKEISPDSLQNPSDEDATFRRKNGEGYQGYVGNIVESYEENVGIIITQYDYDVNRHADADFAKEVIEALGEQEERTVIIADGAYSGEGSFEAGEKNNIELVTTTLTGQVPPVVILDFVIEDDIIVSCPAGHTPTEATYDENKDSHRACFDRSTCENCPKKEECPSVIKKTKATVKLSTTTLNRAAYVEKLSTDLYKNYAKIRNGVEGIPSVLRRRYRVDSMPVRGLLRTKMWFGFKIGAIIVKRAIESFQTA